MKDAQSKHSCRMQQKMCICIGISKQSQTNKMGQTKTIINILWGVHSGIARQEFILAASDNIGALHLWYYHQINTTQQLGGGTFSLSVARWRHYNRKPDEAMHGQIIPHSFLCGKPYKFILPFHHLARYQKQHLQLCPLHNQLQVSSSGH